MSGLRIREMNKGSLVEMKPPQRKCPVGLLDKVHRYIG